MYYIKNAPENASLPTIFENMRFTLPLPLRAPNSLALNYKSSQCERRRYIKKAKEDFCIVLNDEGL
jgi:hypothetical protein